MFKKKCSKDKSRELALRFKQIKLEKIDKLHKTLQGKSAENVQHVHIIEDDKIPQTQGSQKDGTKEKFEQLQQSRLGASNKEAREDVPKKKRFRIMLKSYSGSSSHAPEPSGPEPPPVPEPLVPEPSVPEPPPVPVASVPRPSVPEPTGPEIKPSKHNVGRESSHYWTVEAIDEEHDIIKELRLEAKEIYDVPDGLRIIVEFDDLFCPIGQAAGLLASVCGIVASNSLLFPICFEKWPDMPENFFEDQWITLFNRRFLFKVNEDMAKRYLLQSLNRKWREHRIKLWDGFEDPILSKSEIINKVPEGVSLDHWALFVEYRLKPETQEQCKRNKENKKKQVIPHTCGAKSLARRRHELKLETGKIVGRGPMWNITHKRKKDSNYVNDEAKEIGEKIENYLSQNPEAYSEISPNDAVGKFAGPEHSGRVRGLGLGVVPTLAFKHTTTRLSGMNFSSTSAATSSPHLEKKVENLESKLEALMTYICAKEGGSVPQELSSLFTSSTQ